MKQGQGLMLLKKNRAVAILLSLFDERPACDAPPSGVVNFTESMVNSSVVIKPVGELLCFRSLGALHTAGYQGSFVPFRAEHPFPHPQEPPHVPTVLSTVGSMD